MYYLLKTCSFAVFALFLFGFKSNDTAWKEYFQNDQIKIEIKQDACNNLKNGINKNHIFLRVSNKTNEKVQVSFFKETWYDGKCSNCNSQNKEFTTDIILNANETIEGTCESDKSLKILHSMQNGSTKVLTKFDIKDVKVTKVN